MRVEKDFLGSREIPDDALWGIHSARAVENFPNHTRFSLAWYKALGKVKQAYYMTYQQFSTAVSEKFGDATPFSLIGKQVIQSLELSAREMSEGCFFDHFVVPAIQGGAGTSINMNVNEILANASLQKMQLQPGEYHLIDPLEHANIYQSTNDVVPSSLKLAATCQLVGLEESINKLRHQFEELESIHRHSLRVGFTQMQEAVPTTFGRLLGSYSEALSRDWWRVSKCQERLKQLNLGGGDVGTGLAVPKYFIAEVIRNLRTITPVPLSRAENMADATSNLDCFTEVHATLKTLAVNLEKIANDIRLLSSDFAGRQELNIPHRQAGSSMMPGKVNPVVVEYIISVSHSVCANDVLVSGLCGAGCLELNAYVPIIGHRLLESIELLASACDSMGEHLVNGMEINAKTAQEKLFSSTSISAVLVPYVGYHRATELSLLMKTKGVDVFEANKELNIIPEQKLKEMLKAENIIKEGFSVGELTSW